MLWQDVTRVAPPLISLSEIERAAERICRTVVRTPLIDVSHLCGRTLWLKAELVVGPSGAASVAAALATSTADSMADSLVNMDEQIVAVVSGGNIAESKLSEILERVGRSGHAIPLRRGRQ